MIMRTSLVSCFLVMLCILMLGSGCSTLRRWWYGPDKKGGAGDTTLGTGLGPEGTLGPGSGLDANAAGTLMAGDNPLSGRPFAETRTVDASAIFAPVHFAYDSFVLPPQEVSKVDDVAKFLMENEDRVVNVDGHCDERGSNEYNLSLGEQRAQSVRTYLVSAGIDAARIQTRSFGKEKPLDPGHSESAWAKNRRGEFVIYK
jgi:peptidoglycan-associated lipoprotein